MLVVWKVELDIEHVEQTQEAVIILSTYSIQTRKLSFKFAQITLATFSSYDR